MTQQHWFYFSLFVTDCDYMKCQNHRDQSSYPALYLGISSRLALMCFARKYLVCRERGNCLNWSIPHHTPPVGLHIKASHSSLLMPSNGFHDAELLPVISCAQVRTVHWNENHCWGFALGWLDHDWGGWKSLVLGFVKQRGARRETTHSPNFYKLTGPMEGNVTSDKSQLMPILMCR